MRPHAGGRSPPFIVIGLLVVIAILAFNYWNVSSKNSVLARDIADLSERYRLASVKKLAVEKRNDVLMAKVQETENEVKKNQVILTKKQEELNNINAQHSAVNEEASSCKSELEKCSSEQYQSRQTIKDLEHAVEEAQSERDTRIKENEDCKVALEAARSSVPNCSTDLDTQRIKILETVRNLWGSAAVTLLGKSSIDITGVSLDSAQNPQQTYQNVPQKWPQQQPGMQLPTLSNGGGQLQNSEQRQGQTQGQGQGGLNNMVNVVGVGQNQNQPPAVAIPGGNAAVQVELNPKVNQVPDSKVPEDPYAPARLTEASQGVQSNMGQPSVIDQVQPGVQGKTGLQAPEPQQLPAGGSNPSDENKPALQQPPQMNEQVGQPPVGQPGETGLNPQAVGENPPDQKEEQEQNGGVQTHLSPDEGDGKRDGLRSKRATKRPAVAGTGAQTDTVPQENPEGDNRYANQVENQGQLRYQPSNMGAGQESVGMRNAPFGTNDQIRAPEGVGQANADTMNSPVGGDVRDPGMYREQDGPGVEDDTDYQNRAREDEDDDDGVRPLGQDLQYKKDQYDGV
jgi:hypothetical protein